MEIQCTLSLGSASAVELRLFRSDDGHRAVTISYDGLFVDVFGTKLEWPQEDEKEALSLQVFADQSVLEVFVNGGRGSATKVVYPTDVGKSVGVVAHGGTAHVHQLTVWPLKASRCAPDVGT